MASMNRVGIYYPSIDTIKIWPGHFRNRMSKVVDVNVGGVNYTTTLTSVKGSLLTAYFSEDSDDVEGHLRDSHGARFIDRDGILFRYILDYLRNRRLILPENFSEKERLINEVCMLYEHEYSYLVYVDMGIVKPMSWIHSFYLYSKSKMSYHKYQREDNFHSGRPQTKLNQQMCSLSLQV